VAGTGLVDGCGSSASAEVEEDEGGRVIIFSSKENPPAEQPVKQARMRDKAQRIGLLPLKMKQKLQIGLIRNRYHRNSLPDAPP
jgi:hypothetical protein